MKKLFWSMGMTAVLALAICVLLTPNGVNWTWGTESKPAGVMVITDNSSLGAGRGPHVRDGKITTY
jgi:hypothetical protein